MINFTITRYHIIISPMASLRAILSVCGSNRPHQQRAVQISLLEITQNNGHQLIVSSLKVWAVWAIAASLSSSPGLEMKSVPPYYPFLRHIKYTFCSQRDALQRIEGVRGCSDCRCFQSGGLMDPPAGPLEDPRRSSVSCWIRATRH